jgi:Skp family chaperone for outer membrane proteins
MTRVITTAVALMLAGGTMLAEGRAQARGQTTPPPATTQKPTPPPAPQTPAKPTTPELPAVQQLPFPSDATIAYVQLQGIIAGSKFGRCGSQVLNDLRAKDQAVLAPKQKEVQDLQAKIQSQQGVVTDAVMTQMQHELQRLQLAGQAIAQQQQNDEQNKNQDMLKDFQSKVYPLLETLRKEKNLQFILSADGGGAILVANAALDVTAEVVKRMDVAYPDCKR